jgi:hypothetical protein
VKKRYRNVELRRQHLDVTGVGTSLQVVFPVGVCVYYCVALVLISGVLWACHQIFISSTMEYE